MRKMDVFLNPVGLQVSGRVRILLSTISWFDRRMLTIPKLNFIHGDQVDAPIRYVYKYVLFRYTNREGKDVTVSSQGPY